MDSGAITQEEVWQIADMLSADRHVGEGLATAESLAEAFGVPVETIVQELDTIRKPHFGSGELDRLRLENERLKGELLQRGSRQSPYEHSSFESTTYDDGFIETVRSERVRQAAWVPLASFILFIVVAVAMYAIFDRQSERMRSDFPFNDFPKGIGPRQPANGEIMKEIFEERKKGARS